MNAISMNSELMATRKDDAMVTRRAKSRRRVASTPLPKPDDIDKRGISSEAIRLSEELEEALDATFPASDPVSELSSLVPGCPRSAPKR
jgi:hypothetical protein